MDTPSELDLSDEPPNLNKLVSLKAMLVQNIKMSISKLIKNYWLCQNDIKNSCTGSPCSLCQNKLAKLQATLVRIYDLPTDRLAHGCEV